MNIPSMVLHSLFLASSFKRDLPSFDTALPSRRSPPLLLSICSPPKWTDNAQICPPHAQIVIQTSCLDLRHGLCYRPSQECCSNRWWYGSKTNHRCAPWPLLFIGNSRWYDSKNIWIRKFMNSKHQVHRARLKRWHRISNLLRSARVLISSCLTYFRPARLPLPSINWRKRLALIQASLVSSWETYRAG